MNDSVLRVSELRTHFRTRSAVVRAVDGVDFILDPGQTLCVVGESGCGKSVMVRSLVRLVFPPATSTGRVELRADQTETDLMSLDPLSSSMRVIRGQHFGMVFQDPMNSLSPVHRIGDQISEGLRVHLGMSPSERIDRAIDLLTQVGMPDPTGRVRSFPHQLSGGMRQRAMIAMAIARDPAVLIADEPTTALDVSVQAQILALFRSLQDRLGMSMIFVTHDLGVVAAIAHRILVMYLGVVVENGPARLLLSAPAHPYTRLLLESTPRIDSRRSDMPLATIPGQVPRPGTPIPGCRFFERCPVRVRGLCDTTEPPLVPVGDGHFARCVHAGTTGSGRAI